MTSRAAVAIAMIGVAAVRLAAQAPSPSAGPRNQPGAALPRPAAASAPRDIKAIEARLASLKAEAAALAGEQRTLLGRLRQLELIRETRTLERARTTARLTAVTREASAAGERVLTADRTLAALTPEVTARLVRLFKLLPIGYDRLLLTLDDARSFDRAARMVAVLARRDRERLEEYRRVRAARRADAEQLGKERRSLESLQGQLGREEEALVEASAEQSALLRRVRGQRDLNDQLTEELSAARDRLDQSVRSLTAGDLARGSAGAALRLVPGAVAWPVDGRVGARFGRQASSRFGTSIVRNGIEIEAVTDTPVRAVHPGLVAFSDLFSGFGRVVILDHGGKAYTLYGHLASASVNKGQQVSAGQIIGAVGTAPSGDASLYFELRIDGRPVDPVEWLKR